MIRWLIAPGIILPAAFLLCGPCLHAQARDAHSVGEWLGGKAFCGQGVNLAFDNDGFFALRMERGAKKPVQNVTGRWRLAPDGINLILFNHQDAEIHLSVGSMGVHGALDGSDQIHLAPDCEKNLHFRITGLLQNSGGAQYIIDAASGRRFEVKPDPLAEPDKFAIAEVEFENGFGKPGALLKHSRPVPRFAAPPAEAPTSEVFKKGVMGKYWLLPPDLSSERTVLRFGDSEPGQGGAYAGNFDVTGRGVRLDGNYRVDGENLTLTAPRASLRNLEIIGLESLARQLPGQFAWRLSSRGLELTGKGGLFRMLAQ